MTAHNFHCQSARQCCSVKTFYEAEKTRYPRRLRRQTERIERSHTHTHTCARGKVSLFGFCASSFEAFCITDGSLPQFLLLRGGVGWKGLYTVAQFLSFRLLRVSALFVLACRLPYLGGGKNKQARAPFL